MFHLASPSIFISFRECSSQPFSFTCTSCRRPSTAFIIIGDAGTATFAYLSATVGTVVRSTGNRWFFVSREGRTIPSCDCPMLDWWETESPIVVPWNEPLVVILDGLWSILSRAPIVNRFWRSWAGRATLYFSMFSQTAVASWFSSFTLRS